MVCKLGIFILLVISSFTPIYSNVVSMSGKLPPDILIEKYLFN